MSESDIMLKQLEKYISCEQLVKSGDKVLLAISGGPDSIAMLVLFFRLRSIMNLSLLAVHVNHQLRGAESDADEQFVQDRCRHYNVPLITRKIKLAKESDLENQARIKRFEIFEHLLDCYQFRYVALAHHKNDQAETVLMNIFRGTGLRGLAGIKPKNGRIIHPLLCFDRDQILYYLAAGSIPYRLDRSNEDSHYRRNHIRNVTIPEIISGYNPDFINKINEQANIMREADALIHALALTHLKKLIIDQGGDFVSISIIHLRELKPLEQFYCCREVYRQLTGSEQDFYRKTMLSISQLYTSEGSKIVQLKKNVAVIRQYEQLVFTHVEIPDENVQPVVIDEDRSRLVFRNFRFFIRRVKILPKHAWEDRDKREIVLDEGKVIYPLTIRQRMDGDRFIPFGMRGIKKLKDFFIDEKVPKFDRDSIPILCDSAKILWVVGHRSDHRASVTEATNRYLIIRYEMISTVRKRAANRRISQGDKDEYYEL